MTIQQAMNTMQALREDGWCVVLKALPPEMSFIIEGARSEYDAPCDDIKVGKGKWLAEVSDMRYLKTGASQYRQMADAFGDTPQAAIENLLRRPNSK